MGKNRIKTIIISLILVLAMSVPTFAASKCRCTYDLASYGSTLSDMKNYVWKGGPRFSYKLNRYLRSSKYTVTKTHYYKCKKCKKGYPVTAKVEYIRKGKSKTNTFIPDKVRVYYKNHIIFYNNYIGYSLPSWLFRR